MDWHLYTYVILCQKEKASMQESKDWPTLIDDVYIHQLFYLLDENESLSFWFKIKPSPKAIFGTLGTLQYCRGMWEGQNR